MGIKLHSAVMMVGFRDHGLGDDGIHVGTTEADRFNFCRIGVMGYVALSTLS